jgi:hypothetical protein
VTTGSWIHDDVSRHFKACTQCRDTDAENKRRKHDKPGQVSERDVPAETLAAMCAAGRGIYRSYLRWLAEPE